MKKRKTIESLHGPIVALENAKATKESDGGLLIEADLLVEGHGNEKDKHNYTKQFLKSLCKVMEGKKCFIDHPGQFEEQDRPERSVRDVAGYWTKLTVIESDAEKSVLRGFHKVPGGEGFEQLRSLLIESIEYAKQYPGQCLVGYSINASGSVGDEDEDGWVDVLEADDAVSTDLVTFPGAGGKPLSMKNVESIRESMRKSKLADVVSEILKKVDELCDSKDGERFKDLRRMAKNLAAASGEQGKEKADMKKPKKAKESKEAVTPKGAHPELNAAEASKMAAEALKKAAEMCDNEAEAAKMKAAAAYHSKAAEAEEESEEESEEEADDSADTSDDTDTGDGDDTDGTTEGEDEAAPKRESRRGKESKYDSARKLAAVLKENAELKQAARKTLVEYKIKESGLPTGTHKFLRLSLGKMNTAKEMDAFIEAKKEEYAAAFDTSFGTHSMVRESRRDHDGEDMGGDASDILRETGCIDAPITDDDDQEGEE